MTASNIFKWISNLFTDFLFLPLKWLRLDVALSENGWWSSNMVNWIFLFVLLILLGYWMKQSAGFIKNGTEDRA